MMTVKLFSNKILWNGLNFNIKLMAALVSKGYTAVKQLTEAEVDKSGIK